VKWRFFHQKGRRHTLAWQIAVVGDTVYVHYGIVGGQFQDTNDVKKPVNVGKRNEKSAEQVAQENCERQILMKRRSGYYEVDSKGRPLEAAAELMDFEIVPINTRFWKPTNTLGAGMVKKLGHGDAWATRKRNGMAYPVVVRPDCSVQLYSRVMHPAHKDETESTWNDYFRHIVTEMQQVVRRHHVPGETLFLGELVSHRDHDDFEHVQSVIKSLCARALRLQAERGFLYYYLWGVGFWEAQPACGDWPMEQQYDCIETLFHGCEHLLPTDVYFPEEIRRICHARSISDPVEALRAEAIEREWEGWVVVDPTLSMGDRAWNLRGKTDRSALVAGKLKPIYEDDFVAMWNPDEGIGEWGTGNFKGSVGSVALYQYTTNGTLTYICNAKGGIKEQGKDKKAPPDSCWRHILEDVQSYPLVVEVHYDSRTYVSKGQKTDALSFPRLVHIRSDKAPEECVNPEL